MCTSNAQGSKSISNASFEDELSFESDEDETLCYSWDAGSKTVEKWSEGWACVVSLSYDNVFFKVSCFPLDYEKIASKLKLFSGKDSIFKSGVSVHD